MAGEITLPEAAYRLAQSWSQTWRQVLNRELPAERRGNRWYVDEAAVERLAREREARNLTKPAA